jgi:hypothetical protein
MVVPHLGWPLLNLHKKPKMATNPNQHLPVTCASFPVNMETNRHSARNTWFPKLEEVTRPTVETAAAAYYLNRKQQTLREWACRDHGAIRPIRVHGRLAWPVSEIKRVMGLSA